MTLEEARTFQAELLALVKTCLEGGAYYDEVVKYMFNVATIVSVVGGISLPTAIKLLEELYPIAKNATDSAKQQLTDPTNN